MDRKRIEEGEGVPVRLGQSDVKLIEGLTLFDDSYVTRLSASPGSTDVVGSFTLDELDDLLGCIAADANHTEDRRLERELDSLYDRLQAIMDAYDDGRWQDSAL